MNENHKNARYKILEKNIMDEVDVSKETFLILSCAIIIASVGLNTNSIAVIIGAMLISPLMSPIQGIGLGLSKGDVKLTYKFLYQLLLFILISVASSTFYFILTPISEATEQIISRTSPTLWDVLIAAFGGIAGVIGKAKKDGGNVTPGVAIATALMPPLCVVGYGFSQSNFSIVFGAGYLFIINLFCIMTSTFIGVKIYYGKMAKESSFRQKVIFYVITFLVVVPSIYTASILVKESYQQTYINQFINTELKNHYVFDRNINNAEKIISFRVVGDILSKENIENLEKKLFKYKLNNYNLIIKQLSDNKYLTAQELSSYLKKEAIKTNESKSIKFDEELEKIENILYKDYKTDILDIQAGRVFDSKKTENFICIITVKNDVSDETINKIKESKFNTKHEYIIIIQKREEK
ncbi:TIGR00341 family protein [Leptotrichia sp. OH3620_COT-345]|uniref:TIGR00341 family protein n=1 Tax=Leptotrichia sp. OH3620_COT-345 TaxID=2491048 RepID=UPI000F6527C4|nr:TIGR00341 family protein [Leptotrichia sp. OH3620_COT-345]RRD41003.1 TIGR00341 family protein [Leptotrichia sp. OH3620_COT-345]